MRLANYEFEVQLEIIENSYNYSKKKFPNINTDIEDELKCFAEIENKFKDIKNSNEQILDKILKTLINFKNDNNNELNKRKISQAKNNYWKVFDSFDVILNEDKLVSKKFILIFLNTYYCMLYFKVIKSYEKDILNTAGYILGSLRGTLFDADTKSTVKIKLLKIDEFIDMRNGYENYFFYQSILRFGTMGIEKENILQGFVPKMRNASISAKRETISGNLVKLPNISLEKYLLL